MAITKATASSVAPAAKGDLVVGSGTNDAAVLGVGSANQVLTVDSSTGTGLKWAAPGTPNFVGVNATRTNQSTALTSGAGYRVAFNSEEFDTDSFHDNSTNNSRITIPSGKGGKYLIEGYANNALGSPGGYQIVYLFKNGSALTAGGVREGYYYRRDFSVSTANQPINFSTVANLAAGDYIEMEYLQNNTETVNMWFYLQAVYLGA